MVLFTVEKDTLLPNVMEANNSTSAMDNNNNNHVKKIAPNFSQSSASESMEVCSEHVNNCSTHERDVKIEINSTATSTRDAHESSPHGHSDCHQCDLNCNFCSKLSSFIDADALVRQMDMSRHVINLTWNNLSYNVSTRCKLKSRWLNPFAKETMTKTILKPMSGHIKSGTMTALMGPSGAGKSTFLNCLVGKIKLPSGSGESLLTISSMASPKESQEIRIGLVPQKDCLFSQFTVQETLLFASKLNNASWDIKKHEEKIASILSSLDLSDKANSCLSKLSGGQFKRVSVATELISNPSILILDEPTSGLDSDSAESLIKLLKRVTVSTNKDFVCTPAIIAIVHSPSYEIFSTFDTIYLLNKRGGNIYNGPPGEIMNYLKSIGFPGKNTNPADYAIAVADGKYGEDKFEQMESLTREKSTNSVCTSRLANLVSPTKKTIAMSKFVQKPACSASEQITKLVGRSLSMRFIKSPQAIVLAMMHVATGMMLVHLHATPVGLDPVCWEKKVPNDNIDRSTFTASDLIYETKLRFDVTEKMKVVTTVASFVYFTGAYILFISGIVAQILSPYEFPMFKREIHNTYYTVKSFYFSKLISDTMVVFLSLLPATLYIYYFSGQLMDGENIWRLAIFVCLIFIISCTWNAIGSSIGLLLPDILVAIAVSVAVCLLSMFISDFVIKTEVMISGLAWMSKWMNLQNALGALMVILYGHGRCGPGDSGKLLDLSFYNLPWDLFNRLWYGLNFQYEDMRRQARILDTEEDYMYSFHDIMLNWMGPKKDPSYNNPSFLLEYFHLTDDLTHQTIVLAIWLVAAQIFLWFAIKDRAEKLESL